MLALNSKIEFCEEQLKEKDMCKCGLCLFALLSTFFTTHYFISFRKKFSCFSFPVGKISEKALCKSVFLTIWHCFLSAELNSSDCFFWRFCPLDYKSPKNMFSIFKSFKFRNICEGQWNDFEIFNVLTKENCL